MNYEKELVPINLDEMLRAALQRLDEPSFADQWAKMVKIGAKHFRRVAKGRVAVSEEEYASLGRWFLAGSSSPSCPRAIRERLECSSSELTSAFVYGWTEAMRHFLVDRWLVRDVPVLDYDEDEAAG